MRAVKRLGMAMAAITRMIVTTIRSSMRENPLRCLRIFLSSGPRVKTAITRGVSHRHTAATMDARTQPLEAKFIVRSVHSGYCWPAFQYFRTGFRSPNAVFHLRGYKRDVSFGAEDGAEGQNRTAYAGLFRAALYR